jgi:hypothetical protein
VDAAVDLEREPELCAVEVHDEAANHLLTGISAPGSADREAAQGLPRVGCPRESLRTPAPRCHRQRGSSAALGTVAGEQGSCDQCSGPEAVGSEHELRMPEARSPKPEARSDSLPGALPL